MSDASESILTFAGAIVDQNFFVLTFLMIGKSYIMISIIVHTSFFFRIFFLYIRYNQSTDGKDKIQIHRQIQLKKENCFVIKFFL